MSAFVFMIPVLLFAGLFMLFIGVGVIVTRRPLILSGRLLRGLTVAAFIPVLARPFVNHGFANIAATLMWLFLLWATWLRFEGYSVFGIDMKDLRQSVRTVLRQSGMTFIENSEDVITVMPGNIRLETGTLPNGVYRIFVKDKAHAAWLDDLGKKLRATYDSGAVPATLTFCVFYCLFGILMTGFLTSLMLSGHIFHKPM